MKRPLTAAIATGETGEAGGVFGAMMNRAKQRRSDSNRSEKVCPVCSGSFRYDLAMMNLHVDACLGKSSSSSGSGTDIGAAGPSGGV